MPAGGGAPGGTATAALINASHKKLAEATMLLRCQHLMHVLLSTSRQHTEPQPAVILTTAQRPARHLAATCAPSTDACIAEQQQQQPMSTADVALLPAGTALPVCG